MTHVDTVVAGGTVVLPDGSEQRADLGIADGRIAAIAAPGTLTGATTIDAAGRYVLPGLVDPHLHIGLGQGLADWETETRSAAAGGVTTVLTYLMSGEDYFPIFAEARAAADRMAFVDYGFHAVPCSPQHLADLGRYVREAGIASFKFFTSFRGDEGAYLGITGTDDGYLYRYLQEVARHPGAIACIHPENIEIVWQLRAQLQAAGRDDLAAWDESRPAIVEAECILRAAYYAKQTGCPVYFVHISGAEALDAVRWMRARYPGHPIAAETCPHYLTHTKDSPLGSLGKVNPPLRARADIDALWEGLADGTLDTVGSDHVPRRRAKKTGSIWTASAGFPGTASILPVLLSEGVHRRGLSLGRVAALTAANPARLFGLGATKGSIRLGADADLCLIDLDREQVADAAIFQSSADYSLYDGWTLKGWPVMTILRGQVIMRDGTVVGTPGAGRYLHRGGAAQAA
ncbi:MAG: amidohydrolase family protein [Chloroflexota bacterium]|nr:amidohydrolase family protein [Dehalococcoidia bacterium]MDW8254678.1 amidohydrolase family protein [Chloroflexota bacterium]